MAAQRPVRRPLVFVVGVDGSDIAKQAFHATCRMMDKEKDELYLFHVTNPGRYQDMPECFQPGALSANPALAMNGHVCRCD